MEVWLSRGDDISTRQGSFLCGETELLDGTYGPVDVKRREHPCEKEPKEDGARSKRKKRGKVKVGLRLF